MSTKYKYRVGQKRFKCWEAAIAYAEYVKLDVIYIHDGHACWTVNRPLWELVDDEHWKAYTASIREIYHKKQQEVNT